jgi:hypothetical protein
MSTRPETPAAKEETQDCSPLRTIGWLSVGIAAVALGFCFGRELRRRSSFKRRTPYDFYSHTDEQQTSEFGFGL